MKKQILCLTLLVLVLLAMVPVNALTITMANPGGIAERDIIAYFPNGTMQGYYNSTSVITIDPSSDYIFTIKPLSTNILDDPLDFMNEGFAFVQTNVIPILVLMFFIGLVFRR